MSNPVNPITFDWALPPKDSIKYLQSKGFKLSFNYDKLKHSQHHKYFTVAKVTRMDLLKDIFDSLLQAQKSGVAFEQWKKDLIPTLKEYGWWGEVDLTNPKTGEVKKIYVTPKRLQTIFGTNMRVSNATARYNKQKKSKVLVYWRYVAILDTRVRATHRKLHGIIKHKDDPFWEKNYPPNGWRCRCFVQAHSKRELERNGWRVEDKKLDDIADKDWAYSMDDTRVAKVAKVDLDKSLDKFPSVKDVKKEDYKALSESELLSKFFTTLGVSSGDMFIDKVGDPMIIDESLFKVANGFLKIKKQNREMFIEEFAKTISDPDEIYLEVEKLRDEDDKYIKKSTRVIKKMFRYLKSEGDSKRGIMVLFEYLKDKTLGVSAYFVNSPNAVENKRGQKLIYKRDQEGI